MRRDGRRQEQGRGSTGGRTEGAGRARRGRGARTGRAALLVLLALMLGALLASAGQAQSSRTRSPEEEEARATRRAAEREARGVRRAAEREERAALHRSERSRERAARSQPVTEVRGQTVLIACGQITWEYTGFENVANNTVKETVTIDRVRQPSSLYSFNGSSSTHVMAILTLPGSHQVDAEGQWNTNGKRGNFDIHLKVECGPAPAFTIEKLQRIGSEGAFTSSPITGEVGKTVDYEILLRNTGNVPLTFEPVLDGKCDAGTIAGGPGASPLAPGGTSTVTCSHALGAPDLAAGSYTNTAFTTATPPAGDGSFFAHTSNTVSVAVVPPAPPSKDPGSGTKNETSSNTTTGSSTSGSAGTSPIPAQQPKSGVLGYSAASVPGLKGPQGCVRSAFHASLKSAGVQSVTFYLDGHRLRTLGARSARRGLIGVDIDPSRLTVGAHHLTAMISMAQTATAKGAHGARTMTVLRCHSAVVTPKFTG